MDIPITNCVGCQGKSLVFKEAARARCTSCGAEHPLFQCPGCGGKTLLDMGGPGGNPSVKTRFQCLSCGGQWPEDELACCPQCGELSLRCKFEELTICRNAVGFLVCGNCYERFFR